MMRYILFFWTAAVESTSSFVYNLTRLSDVRLAISITSLDGRLEPQRRLTSSSWVEEDELDDDSIGVFSIAPYTQIERIVDWAMMIPPSETYPSFRLIGSSNTQNDHSLYCRDGAVGLAALERGGDIRFRVSVELIQPSSDISRTPSNTTREQAAEFLLDTTDNYDVIPFELYRVIRDEFSRLEILFLDDENIAILPSVQYTIYRSSESHDVVARIVLEPRDYIGLREGFASPLLYPDFSRRLQIGLNTLQYVGIFIDYRNRHIGFCEPAYEAL